MNIRPYPMDLIMSLMVRMMVEERCLRLNDSCAAFLLDRELAVSIIERVEAQFALFATLLHMYYCFK